jgi:hypothetical protein
MCRLGIAIAIWLGLTGASGAQVSCQKIGQQTYCSNGQVLQRFGNTISDGKGHTWQESGDRTTSSDGTTYQRSGSQILDSKGNSLQRFGNQTLRSNGTVYQNSGNGANVSQQLGTQKPAANSFCYPIGGQIFCDPAPTKPKPQAGKRPQAEGETTEGQPTQPAQ